MGEETVKYSDNTVAGIKAGDIFNVKIVIQKVGDVYSIKSQTIEVKRNNSNILEFVLSPVPANVESGGNGSELGGGSSANVYSNEVYQLPKKKRKIKQVYNKTLSRKKHPSIIRG